MKKFLTILIAFMLFLPFTFVKTEAKRSSAGKYTAEINYIEPANYPEAEFLMSLDNNPEDYPYTPVAGDLCVFADGATTGTYKCAQYNTSWHAGTVVEKTIAQLQAALANGTHVAVFGDMYHKHGLETADTSDDVTYTKFSVSDQYLYGNYYLTEDITLQQDYDFNGSDKVCIDLCGHVINLNGHKFYNVGTLTFESCTDTPHKFIVNADGTYTWDDKNGTVTVNGGLITGNFAAGTGAYDSAFIYNRGDLAFKNVVIAGTKDSSTGTTAASAFIFSDNDSVTFENCKIHGNSDAETRAYTFISGYRTTFLIKNTEFKYNNFDLDGGLFSWDGNTFTFDNVVITNNTVVSVSSGYGSATFKNKVIINNNKNASGTPANYGISSGCIALDPENPLTNDSVINLTLTNGLASEQSCLAVICGAAASSQLSHFKLDKTGNWFLNIKETEPNNIYVTNYVSEEPTDSNQYKYILDSVGTKDYTISYQWTKCTVEEIAPVEGPEQNYVATEFMLDGVYPVKSTYSYGYWYLDGDAYYSGLVLDLKKGDILYIRSWDGYSTFLTKAPNYSIDYNNTVSGMYQTYVITEDGTYGIVSFNNSTAYYVIHPTKDIKGQTTNQFTANEAGAFVCTATYKKSGKTVMTTTSMPIYIPGAHVDFVVPDSTIKIDGIDVVYNSLITKPEDPSSIKVIAWYYDEDLTIEWLFDEYTVDYDMVLYAKYQPDIDISIKTIVAKKAKSDCIITVGEGLQLTLDNFYSFTFNGTTYLKSELDLVDKEDASKGYTNGTFTVEEGCIKITMPQNYINTFGLGTYDLSVQLTGMFNGENVDGMILSGSVQVVEKIPGTGVETNNSLFEIIALTGIACAACYIVLQKKHN